MSVSLWELISNPHESTSAVHLQSLSSSVSSRTCLDMLCKSITALAAASLASAATPSGFEPASTTELIVTYNGVQAQSGSVVARDGKPVEYHNNPLSWHSRGEGSTLNLMRRDRKRTSIGHDTASERHLLVSGFWIQSQPLQAASSARTWPVPQRTYHTAGFETGYGHNCDPFLPQSV
jgi:hypothetical protein